MDNIKIGDSIVCIDNSIHDNFSNANVDLTIGKIYIVLSVVYRERIDNKKHKYISVLDDSNIKYGYYDYRFVSLKDYRSLKLQKLNIISKI